MDEYAFGGRRSKWREIFCTKFLSVSREGGAFSCNRPPRNLTKIYENIGSF